MERSSQINYPHTKSKGVKHPRSIHLSSRTSLMTLSLPVNQIVGVNKDHSSFFLYLFNAFKFKLIFFSESGFAYHLPLVDMKSCGIQKCLSQEFSLLAAVKEVGSLEGAQLFSAK